MGGVGLRGVEGAGGRGGTVDPASLQTPPMTSNENLNKQVPST